jgi:hypothetical protein
MTARIPPMRIAALLLLASLPAVAQDRPPAYIPTRDVAVEYRLQSEGQTQQMRIAWLAARGLMRMEMPMGFAVMDQRSGQGFMAMTQQRMVMDMAAGNLPAGSLTRPPESARFTREGQERIAGQACTVWRMEDRGETARSCITADGVMLRTTAGSGNRATTIEATRVDYATQDPAQFNRPQGFQSLQLPPGIGTLPGGAFPQRGTALPPPGLR